MTHDRQLIPVIVVLEANMRFNSPDVSLAVG
jgi:hypothetical protein